MQTAIVKKNHKSVILLLLAGGGISAPLFFSVAIIQMFTLP